MHILKVLYPLRKLESRISELYEWFSRIFADDTEAASLFYRISIDETAHADLVRYQERLASRNNELFGEIPVDIAVVDSTLEMVTSVLSGPPPSLEQAVRIALDIESSAAESHYRATIAHAAPDISRLLSSLRGFDNRHREIFEEFAAARGFISVTESEPSTDEQEDLDMPDNKGADIQIPVPPEVLSKIQYYYEWHESMDFYKLLGIKDYASDDEIRKAFRSLAREFHPDSYVNAAEKIKRKLHIVFSHMTDAYSTLIDPDRRKHYDMTQPRFHK